MRKIEKAVIPAFLRRERATCGNTMTDGESLFLHGNRIAWWQDLGTMAVSSADWPTATTASRLRAIASAAFDMFGKLPFRAFRSDGELFVELPRGSGLSKQGGGTFNACMPVLVDTRSGWTREDLRKRAA